ncbi:extensin-like [Capsicum chacoense]
MSDPYTPNPIGTWNFTVISEPPETSEARAAIQHDEHVTRLTQKVEDLWGELNRVKDLTNLSIILQSPPPEPRNTGPNPPHFPSLDSPIPKHFPPQHPLSINNNSLPATS